MRVQVDAAREHEPVASVDLARRTRSVTDVRDTPVGHADVGAKRAARRDDGAAADR
jgi:hypothetical protein